MKDADDAANAVLMALDRGDPGGAVELMARSYTNAVYNVCRRMLRGRVTDADIDDACQDVFMNALADIGQFDRRSPPRHWLISIARHRCIDRLRQRHRSEAFFDPGGSPEKQRDYKPISDDEVNMREIVAMLGECLDSLRQEYRGPVLMKYSEEQPYSEISATCGKSQGTLRVWVSRAMVALKQCLELKGVEI